FERSERWWILLVFSSVFAAMSAVRYSDEVSLRGGDVPNCASWVDPGQEHPWPGTLVRQDQKSHDRQAPEADRTGCEAESPGALPSGNFLRPLFLCRAEPALV